MLSICGYVHYSIHMEIREIVLSQPRQHGLQMRTATSATDWVLKSVTVFQSPDTLYANCPSPASHIP